MKEFKAVFADFEGHNPFPLFYENGYTPEIIKKEIIKSFRPFFENRENLENYAIDGLATTWISFLTTSKEKGFKFRINKISSLTRLAFKINPTEAVKSCFDWSDETGEAINKYWSVKKLEQNIKQLCLDDMVVASFQLIGQIIESLIKPYIKFHYQLLSIATNVLVDKDTIEKCDLGIILKNISELNNGLVSSPLNISLNQWRNIAYHHNYLIEGKTIICSYGNAFKRKQINLTKKQLLNVVRSVYAFYKTLKISEALITFDNFQLLQAGLRKNPIKSKSKREESLLIGLHTSIGSQGFSVKNLISEKHKTTLVVQDLTDEDPNKRGIHSSQFLHVVGKNYKTKIIEVIYKLADGSTYLISSIKNKTLNDFNEGIINLNELIKYTELNFIGEGSLQGKVLSGKLAKDNPIKKNPFDTHLRSAVPTNEKYYSQTAEEIDVKKFIRDFSLAIFSNFLVYCELGYSSDKIKINVDKDGAMILLESHKKLVAQVPANIKEKLIQQLIKLCIGDIISLFKKNSLTESLIIEARQSINFTGNLTVIQKYLERTRKS